MNYIGTQRKAWGSLCRLTMQPEGASRRHAALRSAATLLCRRRSVRDVSARSSWRRIGSRRRDPHAFRVLQISKKCLIRRRPNASLVCRKGKTLHVSRETLDFPPVYVKMLVCCRVFAGSLCFFKGVLLNG